MSRYPTLRHVMLHGERSPRTRSFGYRGSEFALEDLEFTITGRRGRHTWQWHKPEWDRLAASRLAVRNRWRPIDQDRVNYICSPAIKANPPRWAHRAWKRGIRVQLDKRTGRYL